MRVLVCALGKELRDVKADATCATSDKGDASALRGEHLWILLQRLRVHPHGRSAPRLAQLLVVVGHARMEQTLLALLDCERGQLFRISHR